MTAADRVRAPLALLILLVSSCGPVSGDPIHPPSPTPPASSLVASPPSTLSANPPGTASAAPSYVRGDPRALPGILLIADRGNSRLIEIDGHGRVLWEFPGPGRAQLPIPFRQPDDAFYAMGGSRIASNQEDEQTVVVIDRTTGRMAWSYGHPFSPGRKAGYLNGPDDAYLLASGNLRVADIKNCRVIEISPAGGIVRQLGNGACRHNPPHSLASPNGDSPTADGGFLVTEINGSWVDRFDRNWALTASVHVPTTYPSDALLLPDDSILLTDWITPGAVLRVDWKGRVLWKFGPRSGPDVLHHPSIALPLPNGDVVVADDWGHRVMIVDPATNAVVWEYGHLGAPGSGPGSLNYPDGLDFRPAAVPAAGKS
ncbi:MAG TPA: hypothetical protein VET65_09375 [Candidatus Limnocylindrales bacterium]|nr:hypothetical protein [Candidatus Limnocylindrales bacterium]